MSNIYNRQTPVQTDQMLTQLNAKWLLINLLAILLLLISLSLWQHQLDETPESAAQDYKPDYFLLQATSIKYDESGHLSHKISGQRFTHVGAFSATDIEAPHFQFFQPNTVTWFGHADSGTMIDYGTQIDLTGKVFISNGSAIENPLSLVTESLKILPQQNLLMGHQKATIQSQQGQLHSTGIKLQMDTQILNLLGQVHGQLQPGS